MCSERKSVNEENHSVWSDHCMCLQINVAIIHVFFSVILKYLGFRLFWWRVNAADGGGCVQKDFLGSLKLGIFRPPWKRWRTQASFIIDRFYHLFKNKDELMTSLKFISFSSYKLIVTVIDDGDWSYNSSLPIFTRCQSTITIEVHKYGCSFIATYFHSCEQLTLTYQNLHLKNIFQFLIMWNWFFQ